MDVVYPLKRESSFEELRYSLRSLDNLDHDRVFLVGGRPDWAVNVTHIPTMQSRTKWKNTVGNIQAACQNRRVSDPFILFNDDFFVLEKLSEVPVLNRGRCIDVECELYDKVGASAYRQGLIDTRVALQHAGYDDPLCFDLHVPMVTHKQLRLKAIDMGRSYHIWHARTAYGAMAGLVGETIKDPKIIGDGGLPDGPFVSTGDVSFVRSLAGQQLRERFSEPSRYEAD